MVEQKNPTSKWSQERFQRINELEGSKQFQDKLLLMKEQMTSNLQWKTATMVGMLLAMFSFALFKLKAIIPILLGIVFYYWPQYMKRKTLFGDRIRTNDEIYINEFLCPILKEVFPEADLTRTATYSMDALKVFSPRSSKFQLFNQLLFHDEKNLTVTNLYAYHIETRIERDSNGHIETVEKEVEDFAGQIFSLKSPISFPGHLRVIPTKKSFFLKREVKGAYPGAGPNEVQIETEDIQNNENYNIYCTDELAARKFLKPKILEWFDQQISKNAMCVYFVQDTLYISLYTSRYLFPTPGNKEAIERLSIAEEYQKLCKEIDLVDELTNIFKGE
ncbi:DUF3137 domain-containing protein [Streptococcus sp. OMI633]|uniref:DUF3137 domain-containing protein n=1 Tax=unclassified Streptococcus TaxID=2608887 RepID=UPI0039C4457C